MAAAIGAGLPVNEPTGNMVVDIGGGTTEVAVISLGGIVTSQSIRIGGDELDQAIITFGKKEHSLMLGERTAEEIKLALGSAFPRGGRAARRDPRPGPGQRPAEDDPDQRGRGPAGDRGADQPDHRRGQDDARQVPARARGRRMDRGIALTGGGALLRGLDQRIREETGMPVHIADSPLDSVVLGTGKCVEDFDTLRQVLVPDRR